MRKGRRGTVILVAAVAMLPLAGGCQGDARMSTSTTEATVTGKVSAAGQPLTEGQVIFNPANARRKFVAVRSAPIGKDGTYSVSTLVGSNSVSVDVPAVKGKKDAGLTNPIFSFEVQTGENTFDIELKVRGR